MASNTATPAAGQTAGNGAPAGAPAPVVEVDIGINQQPVIEETRKRKQEGFKDTRPKQLALPKNNEVICENLKARKEIPT